MKNNIILLGLISLISFTTYTQGVKISTAIGAPDNSAMLEVESTDKGVLIPRVTLTATNNQSPITAIPANGLLVFNTTPNGAGLTQVYKGFYYWDTILNEWVQLIAGNGIVGTDDQNIDSIRLNGELLTVWIEDGGSQTIDLQPIIDSAIVNSSDNQQLDSIRLNGDVLTTYIENGGSQSINLRPIIDSSIANATDDQNIDSIKIANDSLTIYIENGLSAKTSLQAIYDSIQDHDWYKVGTTDSPKSISDSIYTMGRVGIGTSIPTRALHVTDNLNYPAIIESSSVVSGIALTNSAKTSSTTAIRSFGNDLQLITNAGVKLHIDTSGNTGLSTTNPTTKLDVNGQARIRIINDTNEVTQGVITARADGVLQNLPYDTLVARIKDSVDDHDWYKTGTTDSPTSINDSIYTQGNVGIGSGSTSKKLTVAFIDPTNHFNSDIANSNGIIVRNNATNDSTISTLRFRSNVPGGSNAGISGQANGTNGMDMHLWTEGSGGRSTKLFIQKNGNVGIGTTNPSNIFTVEDTLRTTVTIREKDSVSPESYAELNLFNGNNSRAFIAKGAKNKVFYTGEGSPLVIGNFDSTDIALTTLNRSRLVIKGNGNVGIGTTTPDQELTVVTNQNNQTRIKIANGSNGTNSQSSLYIEGSHPSKYFNLSLFSQNNTVFDWADKVVLQTGSLVNKGILFTTQKQPFEFRTGSSVASSALYIDTNNHVGIGTVTPSERLEVNGDIKADTVKAIAFQSATTIYPDYVFEDYFDGQSTINPSYEFKSLQEIESYINTNKHLPGVKSIEEVKTDKGYSINLGETSVKNLEKIEELYLHLIKVNNEKNEMEKSLNKRINDLEKKLELLIKEKK